MSSALGRDPYELDSWIGKIVSVTSISGKRFSGRLLALDPVSSSVVLIGPADSQFVLPWVDLDKVQVLSDKPWSPEEERVREQLFKEPKKETRDKSQVISWLTKHHLKVVEAEENILEIQGGQAQLHWPFSEQDLASNNVIVLDRIAAILRQMPSSQA